MSPVDFFLPSPPLRGRGVGGEGVVCEEKKTPSPPTPLPRSGGEGRNSNGRSIALWFINDQCPLLRFFGPEGSTANQLFPATQVLCPGSGESFLLPHPQEA